MKSYQLLFIIYFTLVISSCKNEPQLTTITYEEMVEMVGNNDLTIPKDVPYYSLEGRLLTIEDRAALANDLLYAEWIINVDSTLVKVQFQDSEKVRLARLKAPVLTEGIASIKCDNLSELLEKVYSRDQDSRSDNLMSPEIDEQNLEVIEQILEKCGMPSQQSAGELGHSAIWLVIQHAGADKRKQYFPILLEAAQQGLLEKQDIALMQDRMLMDDGKPQLYGSQVLINDDDTYELYDLQDPETVDKRREEMGLGPLKEYLEYFNIESFPDPNK